MNKFCPSLLCLFSTSSTTPIRLPISVATVGLTMSNGASQICTHKDTKSNRTFFAVIPSCHLRSSRTWLLKVHGPPLNTCSISNSVLNLNWNGFNPTSTMCIPSSIPQALHKVSCVAFLLNSLQVRNFPIKLKTQLSISSLHPSSGSIIISSSFDVSFIFSKLSITSSAMVN